MAGTIEAQEAAPAIAREEGLIRLLELLAKPEVQQSLEQLIGVLPQLTDLAEKLAGAYEVVKSLASDPVFVADMKNGWEEFATPAAEKAKRVASAVIEAKDLAQSDQETIGLLGMVRMLKDPQTQKLLRFSKALLATLNEREQAR